jgi:hypothetical protein
LEQVLRPVPQSETISTGPVVATSPPRNTLDQAENAVPRANTTWAIVEWVMARRVALAVNATECTDRKVH